MNWVITAVALLAIMIISYPSDSSVQPKAILSYKLPEKLSKIDIDIYDVYGTNVTVYLASRENNSIVTLCDNVERCLVTFYSVPGDHYRVIIHNLHDVKQEIYYRYNGYKVASKKDYLQKVVGLTILFLVCRYFDILWIWLISKSNKENVNRIS